MTEGLVERLIRRWLEHLADVGNVVVPISWRTRAAELRKVESGKWPSKSAVPGAWTFPGRLNAGDRSAKVISETQAFLADSLSRGEENLCRNINQVSCRLRLHTLRDVRPGIGDAAAHFGGLHYTVEVEQKDFRPSALTDKQISEIRRGAAEVFTPGRPVVENPRYLNPLVGITVLPHASDPNKLLMLVYSDFGMFDPAGVTQSVADKLAAQGAQVAVLTSARDEMSRIAKPDGMEYGDISKKLATYAGKWPGKQDFESFKVPNPARMSGMAGISVDVGESKYMPREISLPERNRYLFAAALEKHQVQGEKYPAYHDLMRQVRGYTRPEEWLFQPGDLVNPRDGVSPELVEVMKKVLAEHPYVWVQ